MPWLPENKDLENEELQAKDESYNVLSRWSGPRGEFETPVIPILKTSLRHKNTYLKINGEIKEDKSVENSIMFAFGMDDANTDHSFRCGNFMPFNNKNQIAGWDFGLIYQGEYGLHKHFFKEYDKFLHDANESYECAMQLSKPEFMKMDINEPVLLHGQPCLIESMQFAFGEDSDTKISLRSLRPMNNPLS